jgi:hypothetical protein
MNNAATKDIDDVDDDLFVKRKPQSYIFAEKKAQDLTEKTNKMLANSRAIVQETEQVGQSTLENLSVQREALERVENDLDSINTMTRTTQKHLNNMKSFFGGIKSLFSSNNNNPAGNQPMVPSTKGAAMPRSQTFASVPSSVPAGSSLNNAGNSLSRASFATPAASQPTTSEDKDDFEAGLSEIGFGLGRLKEMAMKLGDEIGDQNDMLERITDKSERAGDSVKHQNRQIQQLLKKG